MPRGRRTSYTRDNNGRFASSPGGGAPKRSTPATRRAATRAGNRLNRDNSGRISGIGRNGATVRGGRLKTAKGNKRATQLASMKPAGFRASTIAKGGRGIRGSVARSLAAVRKERMAAKPVAPAKALKRPTAPSVAKPAKKESKRNISDAKAGRIIARLDANRPGLRKATGSDRRNRNLLQTYDRASKFVLAASTRESKRTGGQGRMDLAESVRRAVRNAKAKAKPAKPPSATKPARARRSTVVPALQGSDRLAPLSPQRKKVLGRANARAAALADMANKAKDELKRAQNKAIPARNQYSDMTPQARKTALTRLAKAEKANARLQKSSMTAQRAKSFAEGMAGTTKEGYTRYDNEVRRSDIRTPKAKPKPTAPKRTRSARPAGTVAKPRGMKPGVLAARRGVKAKGSKPKAGLGSLQAIAARRARVTKGIKQSQAQTLKALRSGSMGSLSGPDNARMYRSQVTRSAANEIYNRQRTVVKISGKELDRQSLSSPLNIMRTIRASKDRSEMAKQLREQARKRVNKGRKGRR